MFQAIPMNMSRCVRQCTIVAGIVFVLAGAVAAESTPPAGITTHGVAVITVPAETMRLSLTVVANGETARRAYANGLKKAERLIGEFRRFGLGAQDYETDFAVSRRPLKNEPSRSVFFARVRLTIQLEDYSAAAEMLDVATTQHAADITFGFGVDDPLTVYERALTRAMADARFKAEAIAADAGGAVGAVLAVEELSMPPDPQGLGDILPTPSETDGDEGAVMFRRDIDLHPTTTTIAARVRVRFELASQS